MAEPDNDGASPLRGQAPALITSKGAALLAGVELGWWAPKELPRFVGRPERRFSPRMSPGERDRRYAGWQDAVARVRS